MKAELQATFSRILILGLVLIGSFLCVTFSWKSMRGDSPPTIIKNLMIASVNHLPGMNRYNSCNLENQSSDILEDTPLENKTVVLDPCPLTPPNLRGNLTVSMEIINWEMQEKSHPELSPGGFWQNPPCLPRHRVAILVPFRNRDNHLHIFINYMHTFLQKQLLDYGLYIIEEDGKLPFNRAVLFNVGYKEAMKDKNWQCFVFHDVDNLPVNDYNLYNCPERPKHMSVAVERFNYTLPYLRYFGGVTMLTKDHFEKINGMSNMFWGWGGEDDDLFYRCNATGLLPIERSPSSIAVYKTIEHVRAPTDNQRYNAKLLKEVTERQYTDGLNSLQYKVVKKEYRKLFTYILADVSMMKH